MNRKVMSKYHSISGSNNNSNNNTMAHDNECNNEPYCECFACWGCLACISNCSCCGIVFSCISCVATSLYDLVGDTGLWIYYNLKNLRDGNPSASLAISRASNVADLLHAADVYLDQGHFYWALYATSRALRISIYGGLDPVVTVAKCHFMMGETKMKLDRWPGAIVAFQKAKAIYEHTMPDRFTECDEKIVECREEMTRGIAHHARMGCCRCFYDCCCKCSCGC
jgi:hypothetical protein